MSKKFGDKANIFRQNEKYDLALAGNEGSEQRSRYLSSPWWLISSSPRISPTVNQPMSLSFL